MLIGPKIRNDAKLKRKKGVYINQKENILVDREKHTDKNL